MSFLIQAVNEMPTFKQCEQNTMAPCGLKKLVYVAQQLTETSVAALIYF